MEECYLWHFVKSLYLVGERQSKLIHNVVQSCILCLKLVQVLQCVLKIFKLF